MTLQGSVHSGIGKQFELWKSIAIHTCQGYVVLVRQASNPRWSARWKACKLFGRIRVTWLTWIVEAVERADKRGILNGSPFPPNRLIVRTYLMQIKWWDWIEWGQCWCVGQIYVFETKIAYWWGEERRQTERFSRRWQNKSIETDTFEYN